MNKNKIIIFLTILGLNLNLNAQNKDITINFKTNSDNSVDFYYEKKLPGSFYLNLEFTTLSNAYPKTYKGVLKNNSGNFLKLRSMNIKQPVNFSYKYSYIRGVPNSKVDDLFTYILPFKKGKSVTIFESKNLNEIYFSAEKPSKWKSYTINSTSSDTVCSMRKGIVVEIVNDFTIDPSIDYDYTSKMNRIIIEHEDGSFATYTSLKKNSFFVSLGQMVYPQMSLGVLDKFNNSLYRLYFSIYYMIDNEINFNKKETLKTQKSRNEFLTPYFLTMEGSKKLINQTNYVVEFNENILLQEFSNREKKQYLKNPDKFR